MNLLKNLSNKRYSIIFLKLNIGINHQTINSTTSTNNNSLNSVVPHLAIATSFALLSSILLISIAFSFGIVIAKKCSDESTNGDGSSSSCNSQDSNSVTNSPSRNEAKTPFVLLFS
jgi:hypothetical protein